MDTLVIEKTGGPGFGPGSHLKSSGELSLSKLSVADKEAIERLFAKQKQPGQGTGSSNQGPPKGAANYFTYTITRQTPSGPETAKVTEFEAPDVVKNSVTDRIE